MGGAFWTLTCACSVGAITDLQLLYLVFWGARAFCAYTMTFKQRPSTYRISIAPSNRARCRACKRRVDKGELRIAITAFVRPGRSTQLVRCVQCVDARFGAAMLAVYGTPARVPAEASVSVADATAVRTRLQHIAGERVEKT